MTLNSIIKCCETESELEKFYNKLNENGNGL